MKRRTEPGDGNMNRRGLDKFRNVEELWDRELEEEFGYVYTTDAMEDFRDK